MAAGLILEIAKRRVAEMGSGIDSQAAEQLKNYSYVDDSIMGGSAQDVARMRGERTDAGYTGTVPRILAQGAMKVKFMAVSGSEDPWEASQLAGKTLGVQYRLQEDEIFFQIKPGFYAAKAASTDQVREVVLLGGDEVEEMARGTRKFTRRQALSMVMGVYDPLGLASPALLYGKLLLRRLYGPTFKGGWDADLPQEEKSRWAAWFKNLLAPVEAVFPRSTKPKGAVGRPRLAGFGDASSTALCAVVYIIWTDDEGRHHPRVLTGKCRVAPLLGTTIPRGELQALVVLHRLVLAVLEALPYRCVSVSTFTDSLCSLGAVHKPSSALKPFFGNRVLEILRIREQLITLTDDLAPISHVPGESNPADLGTRGLVSVGDLGPDSYWQTGPAYLLEDFEKWPRTLTVGDTSGSLPPEECVALFGSVADADVQKGVLQTMVKSASQDDPLGRVLRALGGQVLSREKLEVSVRVLARVLVAAVTGRREACARDPPVKMVECAVDILVRMATRGSRQALKDGKLRGLGAEDREGVIWVSGRVRGDTLATLLGSKALPVILDKEPLAMSILHKAHREDHRRGARDAAARSRRSAWIVAATRLAKTVVSRCYTCRYKDRKAETQLMGLLPPERLTMVAPFEATALDLFGPFWVKDAAKGRRSFKSWIVAYVCMGAKAICLLPCPGYSTEVFLTTHRFFCGLYGRPKVIYTDHAPSLIKASETPDWAAIGSQVGAQGTEWRLTAKGCSWRNGLAERVIRSARHTLGHQLRLGETLDFHQFGAVLAVVAAIINARPLSLRVSPEGDYHALSPRDVLFGRAGRSLAATTRALDFTLDVEQDVALLEMGDGQAKIVKAWREQWTESVFPDMVARTKWRSTQRNLRVGDLGHVRYVKAVGQQDWRLAMVETADKDDDGVVRTVTVAFRPRHKRDLAKPYVSKEAQRMTIGVQRFAVLMAIEEIDSFKTAEGRDPHASEMTVN